MYVYEFLCENCGYTATVAGGVGSTRVGESETMKCADCKIVIGVLLWTHVESLKEEIGRCFKCKGTSLSKWVEPYPCPKCDHAMNKGPEGMAC
jgi:predicted RNA-binding Zn-ribbon protein involved in translation (DUF1610 family)